MSLWVVVWCCDEGGGEGGIDRCPEDPRIKRPTKGFENCDIEYRDIKLETQMSRAPPQMT